MRAILLLALSTATALAQGPLTPPGVPAPTMKSLEQIEGRTPIESLPFTISASGSYYFTKNLVFTAASGNAINITVSNVTLDLNGFTLSSSPGVTGNAINVNDSLSNIAVKNGNIVGTTTVTIAGTAPSRTWTSSPGGFNNGIFAPASILRSANVDNLGVSGCRGNGIFVSYGIVSNSTANSNGLNGIFTNDGSVMNSTALANRLGGISANSSRVANSTGNSNGGDGISVGNGSVTSSIANFNGGSGIFANDASVLGSSAISNVGVGVIANSSSVTTSRATNNYSHGITGLNSTLTNCIALANGGFSGGFVDINAPNSVIAFCRYNTGITTGSTLTGNKTP